MQHASTARDQRGGVRPQVQHGLGADNGSSAFAPAIGLMIDGLEIARSQGALVWELTTLVGISDQDCA